MCNKLTNFLLSQPIAVPVLRIVFDGPVVAVVFLSFELFGLVEDVRNQGHVFWGHLVHFAHLDVLYFVDAEHVLEYFVVNEFLDGVHILVLVVHGRDTLELISTTRETRLGLRVRV